MNSDPGEFEALRKLLALKRHEQPPPGYFNRLPDQIAARLARGEGKSRFWEDFLGQFVFRPAFSYGFALAAFGALAASMVYSVTMQPQQSAQMPPNNSWRTGAPDEALAWEPNPSEPLHVANWAGNANSSNPAPALPSLFGSGSRYPAAPVPASFASPP